MGEPVSLPLNINIEARIDPNSTGENTFPEYTAYIKNGLLDSQQGEPSLVGRTGYAAVANETVPYADIAGYTYSDYDKYQLSILQNGIDFNFELRDIDNNVTNHALTVDDASKFDFAFFGLGTNNRYVIFSASTEFDGGGEWNMWSFDLDNLATPPVKYDNASNGINETKTLARGLVELDNYIFAMTTEGEIFNSNVGNHLSWTATDFLTANTAQDKKVYLAKHRDHLVAMGTQGMSFYYNANNPAGSPLALRKDLAIPIGVLHYKKTGVTKSFDTSAETTVPEGIKFNPTRTKAFVLDSATQTVYAYNLSTANDITTMVYSGDSFDVSAQEATPRDLAFSPDGKFMFIVGTTNDTIYRYELSTNWDITTAIYYSNAFSVSAQISIETGMYVSPDGLHMYAVEGTSGLNSRVFEYSLAIANNLGTASYTGRSFSVNGQMNSPQAVFFKPDGLKMYVHGFQSGSPGTRRIAEYSLGTAWQVTSAVPVTNITLSTGAGYGLHINDTGTKCYLNNGGASVLEYTLITPWSLTGITFVTSFSPGGLPTGISLSVDGTAMYTVDAGSSTIRQSNLSTPFSLASASTFGSFTGNTSNQFGCHLQIDDKQLYTMNLSNGVCYRYEMTTAKDITTMNYYGSNSKSVSTEDSAPYGLEFSPDGLNSYVLGNTSNTVYQYTSTVAWDVTKLTYGTNNLAVGTEDTDPKGLTIGDSGNKLYIVGDATDTIYQYEFTSAYDLSTASYASKNKLVSSEDGVPGAVAFSTTGALMWMLGTAGQVLHEYTLGTPWDVDTATIGKNYYYTNSVGSDEEYLAFIATSSKLTGDETVELLHKGVYMFENFVLKKISTDSIDLLISLQLQNRGVNEMRVALHTVAGRKLILVGDGTLVYDIGKQTWYIWTWKNGSDFPWQFSSGEYLAMGPGHIIKYTTKLLKDQDALSPATYNIYPVEVLAPEFTGGTMKQKHCDLLVLDANSSDSAHTMGISYSDDNYQTFSSQRPYNLEKNYPLHRLGSFRKRAWKFTQDETHAGAGENPIKIDKVEMSLRIAGTYRA